MGKTRTADQQRGDKIREIRIGRAFMSRGFYSAGSDDPKATPENKKQMECFCARYSTRPDEARGYAVEHHTAIQRGETE